MAEEIKVSLDTKEFNESIKSLVEKLKTNEDLVKKIEELEKKVNEKKESKGIVTETVQKVAPRFKMVKENNKRYPGTIDIYAEGNNY